MFLKGFLQGLLIYIVIWIGYVMSFSVHPFLFVGVIVLAPIIVVIEQWKMWKQAKQEGEFIFYGSMSSKQDRTWFSIGYTLCTMLFLLASLGCGGVILRI